MKEVPAPHNNFFRFALSDASNARSLLESQLPKVALDVLDLESLRLEQGSFVDADLGERHSDLLFSLRQKLADTGRDAGESNDREDTLVYLLFEHKSKVDSQTVLQLLSYMIRIWEMRIRTGKTLCPIVPLVVYHGEGVWTAAQSMRELLRVPEALSQYQVDFQFPLLDLNRMSDTEIPGNAILRSTLKLLKYSRSRLLASKLRDILVGIVASMAADRLPDWIEAIESYVITVNKNMDSPQYKQTLESILPTKYEVGSLADKLLIQGREEGREEGIREGIERGELIGQIQVLSQMLGDESRNASELRQSDISSLKSILDQLQNRLGDREV